MRGRRTPEICSGEFLELLNTMVTTTSAALMVALPQDISVQQKHLLVREFNAGAGHILFYFTLKLSQCRDNHGCCSSLPTGMKLSPAQLAALALRLQTHIPVSGSCSRLPFGIWLRGGCRAPTSSRRRLARCAALCPPCASHPAAIARLKANTGT